MIGESGSFVDITNVHITAAWNDFRQLSAIMTDCGILLKVRVISSAPVSETSCCMVVKHGQHQAK